MIRYSLRHRQGNSEIDHSIECLLYALNPKDAEEKLKKVYADSKMSEIAKQITIISITEISKDYDPK